MNQIVRLAPSPVSVGDWAAKITARWQDSVEAILDVGRMLIDAKAALPHGEFLDMCRASLPFTPRMGQQLMAVGRDPRLANNAIISHLPPHWSTICEISKLDDEQLEARIADGTIRPTMERKDITAVLSKERRNDRQQKFAQKVRSFPGQKFGIIYADPPWHLKAWSEETGLDRAADQHYPTMSVEDICALSDPDGRHVSDLVVPDEALLLLWITVPFLDRAADVFRAWGPTICDDPEYGPIREPWKYVSNYCWDKEHPATGRWNRNQHEHLLIARIGNVPAPNPSDRLRSIYREPSKEHSAKPEGFAAMIEQIYPDVPKIELFRRGPPRPGWSAWGHEAVQEAA